jgi:DNA-binding MarR family transcriptional regulator
MTEQNEYQRDRVDGFIEDWQRAVPDFDPGPTAIVGRLLRLRDVIHDEMLHDLAAVDLNYSGFHLLVALRRSGPPFRLSPSDIRERYFPMTSGGMVGAIDRLERRGLVRRLPHPSDRRGVLVELTQDGLEVIDSALARYRAMQRRYTDAITPEEQSILVDLLHRLLLVAGDSTSQTQYA